MEKLIIVLLFTVPFVSPAQNDPQKMIDEFFTRYKNKNPNEAIDYIFSTNKWMSDSKDQIENIKFKLNTTLKSLGNYYGYNFIAKKTVGEHLSLYTYLVRHDRQPIRFNFIFYKADAQWSIYIFSYDDSFDDELKEAGRVYRMKENLDE